LLTFARNLQASVETIRPEEVIREVLSFIEKEAEHRDIEISVISSQEIPVIESDRGKLQQIFLNIINNALAATADSGHLIIRLQPNNASGVKIEFEDDGCGIAQEDLHRIFEPFFSTKTGQGGTGLGLSITYNLVQEIHGNINIRSEIGKGTCFTITLPEKAMRDEDGDDADTIGR
jgi:signal transduction histidine kinase